MGQAKNRGSLEERTKEGISKRLAFKSAQVIALANKRNANCKSSADLHKRHMRVASMLGLSMALSMPRSKNSESSSFSKMEEDLKNEQE